MELARQFLTAAINAAPDKKWVAVFEWADSRRVRDKGDGQWSDFGPGLDLCAYEAGHLPEGVAAEQDGAMIALKIPGHIARAAVQKLIDVGAAPATRVTLL